MDLLRKNVFRFARPAPSASTKRDRNSTLILTAVVFFLLSQVAVNTVTTFSWGTDDVTELKILKCIFEIHRGDVANAVKIFNDLNDYANYYLIYMIIKRGYDHDINNMHKLINFTTKLPWCNHQYAGFDYIFDELKLADQLRSLESIQFAFRLKKFLDGNQTCLHKNDDKNLVRKVLTLHTSFPEVTRQIVWKSSKTCLKNAQFGEELYAAGDCCYYDNDRRRVFTWIPKGEIGTQGEWTFEPVDDIASVFWMRNDHFQEYLYAAECCSFDKERRSVFTWIPKTDIGPHGEWVLESVKRANAFRIKNNYFGEHLYAPPCCPYDKERHNVFTKISKAEVGIDGEWEITSC